MVLVLALSTALGLSIIKKPETEGGLLWDIAKSKSQDFLLFSAAFYMLLNRGVSPRGQEHKRGVSVQCTHFEFSFFLFYCFSPAV